MQSKNGLEERTKRTEEKSGIKQEKLETAKKMLEEGINIETIIKITGLTKEKIVEISKK